MRFRRKRDDERREVLLPLLWIARSGYRTPRRRAGSTLSGRADASTNGGDAQAGAAADSSSSPLGKYAAALLAPSAPAPWPIEAALLAAETANTAYVEQHTSWMPGARLLFAAPMGFLVLRLRVAAERRRAIQLGLNADTAPVREPAATRGIPMLLWFGYVRLRGWKVREPPWPRALAQFIIREVDRRRSWNAAMRAGPGSS